MNRLQKKCLIATAGFHLLLLVILLVGPAFFTPKPKVDDSQIITCYLPDAVESALNNGVKNPTLPPPISVPPPQPQSVPPTPAPQIVQPAPQPTIAERLKNLFTPESVKSVPVEPQPHTPKVDMHVVTRPTQKNPTAKPKPNQKPVDDVVKILKSGLSSSTPVAAPGDSDAAVANYASAVRSVYDAAWNLPDSVANDDENVKVSVTIASDGTVITSHITTASGDAPVDDTVQRTLDRVQFIAPFPEGSTDKQRTYIINFNPKAKRLLE